MLDDIRITEGSCTGEGYITSPGGTGGPVLPPVTPRPPITGTCGSVTMSMSKLPNLILKKFHKGGSRTLMPAMMSLCHVIGARASIPK